MAATLDSIVQQAIKDNNEGQPLDPDKKAPVEGNKEAPPANGNEDNKEDKPAEKKGGDPDLTDAELQDAKNIFRVLKSGGPERDVLFDYFAKQGGYTKVTDIGTSKKDQAEAKSDIKNEIMEALGPDYDHLGKLLGPALDKYVARKVDEQVKDIKERQDTVALNEYERQADTALTAVGTKYHENGKIPADIDAEMGKLINRIDPDEGQPFGEYMDQMYKLACINLNKPIVTVDAKKQADKSRNHAPSNLDNTRGGKPSPDNTVAKNGTSKEKPMKLSDVVATAFQMTKDKFEGKQ